jgi:hypothetical protein
VIHRVSLIIHLALALTLTVFTLEQIFAPPSWWIDIRKIYIPDIVLGDPAPVVAVDETVRRNFIARYYFEIRKVGPVGAQGEKPDLSRFTYFCSGDGELAFHPGVDPAANATLDRWTRNRCPKFDVGSYYAQAILVWEDFLTSRSVTVDTNVWNVFPPEPAPVAAAPQIIVKRPVTVVQQQVTKTIVQPPRTIFRSKCEPSLIPPRICPPPRAHRNNGRRHRGSAR